MLQCARRIDPVQLAVGLALVVCGATPSALRAGEAWPQWGGPGRDFRTSAAGIASTWPAGGPRELWRREIGVGYSSIVSDGKRIFTMFRNDDAEEVVIALDSSTGEKIWKHRYPAPVFPDQSKDFGKGPNATPLIVDRRIYTVGFTSKLHCLDTRTGEPIWSHDLVKKFDGQVQQFGYAASPIRFGKMVVVLVGGKKHGAIGFDLADGSVRWSTPPLDFSYASPVIVDVDGEDQLVFMAPTEVIGVAMSDGQVRWRHSHANKYKNNCQGPWPGEDDLLFVSSQADAGSRTLKLSRRNGRTLVEEVARHEQVQFFYSNVIRIGDYVYGASDSTLVAHHIKTGEDAWREPGYPAANLVQAGELTIVLDETGKLSLVTMNETGLDVHASHALLEKPARTAPTLVGSRLYLRDSASVVALDLHAPSELAADKP